jgi:hypothetical protein
MIIEDSENIKCNKISSKSKDKHQLTKDFNYYRRPSQIQKTKNFYIRKENKKLMKTYGADIFKYSLEIDKFSCALQPLRNHTVDSKFRTKLIDWLFEVFFALTKSENTIYLTIHLFDSYLSKTKEKYINDNIHLIGVSCLFIASKLEDLMPIFMSDLIYKITHNRFCVKELKKMEKKILLELNFQIVIHSAGDFISNYYYEFKVTNKESFLSQEQEQNFHEMELFSKHLSKVILHNDEFSGFKNSFKALVSIIIAFEIVRTKKSIKKNEDELWKKWILCLIQGSGYDPDQVNGLYCKIADYYLNFVNLPIAHNLMKNTELPY